MYKHIIMETNKALLDIVFSHRNKQYGAYELRSNYNKRINRALLITLGLVGALVSSFAFKSDKTFTKPVYVTTEMVITEINNKEEVKPLPPPPPKEVQTTQPNTVKYTEPIIVTEPTDPIPAQVDIRGSEIGTINIKGDTCLIAPLPGIDDGKGIIDEPIEPGIFERVEIEAEFPGGVNKWRQYLERNLRVDDQVPEGTYAVLIQFVVDTEGNISDVIALTNHGYGMEDEAKRVIKRGPKWNPAIQNGREVKAYRKQLITFQIGNQE
jgi:protein TonB